MALPDHSAIELSIKDMVSVRLPFFADTPDNDEIRDALTIELMHELNVCYKIQDEDIGKEVAYTVTQRAIISDLVCFYILLGNTSSNMNSSAGEAQAGVFLKSTKAGSVAVEWSQLDSTKGGSMSMNAQSLMGRFKKSAMRKSHTLGCIIDICEDCSIAISFLMTKELPNFTVNI